MLESKKNLCSSLKDYDQESVVQKKVALYLVTHSQKLFGEQKIIDLGSGTGHVSEEIVKYCDEESITNFDISSEMLEICREKFPQSNYVQGDINNIQLNSKFNYLFSNMALQWVESPEKIASCISDCLSAGGKFSVSIVIRGTFNLIKTIREQIINENSMDSKSHLTLSHKLPEFDELRKSFTSHPKLNCLRSEKHVFMQYYKEATDPFSAIRKLGISGNSEKSLTKSEFNKLISEYEKALDKEQSKPYLDYHIAFFWGEKVH